MADASTTPLAHLALSEAEHQRHQLCYDVQGVPTAIATWPEVTCCPQAMAGASAIERALAHLDDSHDYLLHLGEPQVQFDVVEMNWLMVNV